MTQAPATNRDPLHEPSLERLPRHTDDRAGILAAHRQAVRSGSAGYADPVTGFFVMTAATLLARRSCCENGCRHCPYVA